MVALVFLDLKVPFILNIFYRINSFPISHRMCGEFTYDAWFDDDLIVDDSSPMSYDPTLR